MIPKIIIAVLLIAIVASLFSGLFFLIKDTSQSRRTMHMLMLRVGLSLTLIAFLLVAATMGWIHPHGLTGR